jgi:hypothetical protein
VEFNSAFKGLSYFKNVKIVVLPAIRRCITEGKDKGENEGTLPDS